MAACGAGQVDLLEYWAPEGNSSFSMLFCSTMVGTPPGGNITSGTERMSPELWAAYQAQGAPGEGGFLVDGGQGPDGSKQYFVYSYDSQYIYFLEDHVWGGVNCSSGEPAFYRTFNTDTNTWGAPYDRCVSTGTIITNNERAESYIKADYLAGFNQVRTTGSGSLPTPTHCSTPFEGSSTTQKEITVYDSMLEADAGVQCLEEPTVKFEAVGGSGSGETMYLTKGYGMTAFIHQEGGIVDFHSAYVDPSCGLEPDLQCNEKKEGKKPLFIFPKLEDDNEWRKYLSNSQVYCAPTQINWPSFEGQDPPLNPCQQAPNDEVDPLNQGAANGDATCTSTEYPTVDYSESYDLQNFSLPLFRDESGDISIESDLSRVNPDDTFFEAVQANRRPGYAPQFFLTSPQQQCLNAVRYIDYVNELCDKYGDDATECPAKEGIKVKGGRSVDWDIATGLLTPQVCSNFTQEMKDDSVAAQVVRGIEAYTPKAYKMGFLVQHNVLFDRNNPLIGGQYLVKMIASWIKGEEPEPLTREKMVVVPVWYQSGITTNQFSPDQTAAYPIDPETVNPDEVTVNTDNFIGPFWETYGPVLPTHVQEKIAKNKAAIVKDTYTLMKDTFEKILGTLEGDEVEFLGEKYMAGVILSCDEERCLPCSDKEKGECTFDENNNINSAGREEEKEKLEELRQSFPDDFQPSDVFLIRLLRLIVARVNTGVQKTEQYNSENWSPGPPGPNSVRSFDVCPIDQNNTRYGETEQSEGISYKALQKLTDSEDPTVLEKTIDSIQTFFTAKIIWDRQPYEAQFPKSRSYLILPDESIDIDIAESYITPMFLSPQMYDSIMKGDNPIYPWKEENPDVDFMSAFLRTSEYDREHNTEKRGYARYNKTVRVFGSTCAVTSPTGPPTDCSCTEALIAGPYEELTDWIPYPQEYENQSPDPSNGCQEVQYIVKEKSLTNVIGAEVGEDPETNIEVPGKTMALHEFLRRMAFTPHYLIQKYTGLEDFYGGGDALNIDGKKKTIYEGMSDYFAQLFNLSETYGKANSELTCGSVYVDESTAQKYAKEVRALFTEEMLTWAHERYPRSQLYGECGGQTCIDFILDTVLDSAICNGDKIVNPYIAVMIAMNETGGLTGKDPADPRNLSQHFGCAPAAFASYHEGAKIGDQMCTVMNAYPNEVINPLINTVTWTQSDANKCASGSPTWSVVRDQQTAEDGLACMIFRFNDYCQAIESNNLDLTAISVGHYGYRDYTSTLVARFNELKKFTRDTGSLTSEAEQAVNTSITEIISACQ